MREVELHQQKKSTSTLKSFMQLKLVGQHFLVLPRVSDSIFHFLRYQTHYTNMFDQSSLSFGQSVFELEIVNLVTKVG